MPPLKATRGRARLLVLAALLAILPAPGSAGPWPQLAGKSRLLLGGRASLDASSRPVQGAAQTAVNFFNYEQGSPNKLRAPVHVKKASAKVIPGVGRKYFLQITTKDLITGELLGTCHASVFYRREKPRPAVEISCSPDEDRIEHFSESKLFFWILSGAQLPPKLLWRLGVHSSSLIAWEMSTEDLAYTLTDIKDVKQQRSKDWLLGAQNKDGGIPEFDYTVLLGDKWGESFLTCHMRVVWVPSRPARVTYYCSPEDSSSASADGSGEEPGSTDEFFITAENNF